jgi:septum formation protein
MRLYNHYPPIILASASPRRIELLTKTGLKFKVCPAHIEETIDSYHTPHWSAMNLAYQKARKIAERIQDGTTIILGGDTIVVYRDHLLGKPKTKKEAVEMLTRLNGKTHQVITGLCLIQGEKILKGYATTSVSFHKVTREWICDYVASGEPMDKAGAYAIQEKGALLVKKIEGDYPNVIGLPLVTLSKMLSKLGIKILPTSIHFTKD